MALKIRTFMQDSRRPDWLIRLLYEVRTYCPADGAISWIEAIMRDTTLVRRTKVYPLTECVRWEVTDNSLTIYSLFKDRPIVEFTLNSEDPNTKILNSKS